MPTILSSLLLVACSSGVDEPADHGVLMPLETGNTWVYSNFKKGQYTGSLTRRVTGQVRIEGQPYWQLEETTVDINQGTTTVDTTYAYNREDGLWYGIRREGGSVVGGKLYKYPVETGDSYLNPDRKFCIHIADEVAVPAGRFPAVLYIDCEANKNPPEYFSPNIGPLYSGEHAKLSTALASFTLAP